MNPIDNLYSYIRQSTRRSEIMDVQTAKFVTLYVSQFFKQVEACLDNSITLRSQLRAWIVAKKHETTGKDLMVSTKELIARHLGLYCYDGGWLTKDDCQWLQQRFRPESASWSLKSLSDADVFRVIQYFSPDRSVSHEYRFAFSRLRNLLAVMVMTAAGLRIGQIVSLEIDDVEIGNSSEEKSKNITNECLVVRPKLQKKKIKGKSTKIIPLNIKIGGLVFGDIVKLYDAERKRICIKMGIEPKYYFHNLEGGQITTSYYRKVFQNCETQLNITLSAHCLRHTAGTRTANNVGMIAAAKLLDHQSIITTQRYVSLPDDTSDIIRKSFQ